MGMHVRIKDLKKKINVSFWGCGVWNSFTVEDSRVPWTARRSNQSVLKEINPKRALEGLMLKLKLQYDAKSQLNGKGPDLGKIEGRRRRGDRR